MPTARRRLLTLAALLVILGFAAGLRLYGLSWDDNHHLHPDERFLAMVGDAIRFPSDPLTYFDTRRSPLSPYNKGFEGFAYGTAPLFLARAVAERFDLASYDGFPIVGRWLSALADVGTVLLVFLLGRAVYGTGVGLAAAALSAATVLHVQLAHFFAVDTFLAFATTLALLAAYRAWYGGGHSSYALLGFACGLALATKLSAALLAPIVLLAALVPPPDGRPARTARQAITMLAVVGAVALLTYRVGEPYSFAGPTILGITPNAQRFDDLNRWVKISSGEIEVPFMIQWAGTPNPWFALEGIVRWGMGPAAGLAGLLGLAVAALELTRWPRHGRHLLLVAWALVNLGYFGFQFAKFLRYFLPVYPALAVLAAYLLVRALPAHAARLGRPARAAARAALPLTLVLTAGYALAFVSIYGRPNTRVTASEWMYTHLPRGAALGLEHWDDALPLRLPGYQHRFIEVPFTLYDDESPEKVRKLLDSLDRADYIVLASNRLYGSIPRLPRRYPVAIEYYRALFDGRLGFEPVAAFTSEPSLFGFAIDTSGAQEDFTVYDHPTVLIYQKTDRFSPARAEQILASVPLDQIERTKPVDATARKGLLLGSAEWARVQASGTWADIFALDGLTTSLAVPIWLLVVELVGLAVFPLCWRLFPALADRGYGAARVLGLTVVAYVAWLAASGGAAPFGRGLVWASLLLVAAAGALAAWRWRRRMLADLRRAWRAVVVVEAVFLVALAALLLVRALNPDLWHPSFGGEKPMDFAYLNAVVKTPSFPPYDPWFAGGYLNYYYYGFVLVAVLIHLTAAPPFVAYNLAIATVFALTLAAAASAAISLVAGPGGRRGVGRAAVAAGVLSALALGVLGNLDGALQLLEGLWRSGGEGVPSGLPVVTGLTRALVGLSVVAAGGPLPAFDFWRSTRFIGPEDPGPIHEFPYFTFLYGDLHAHMLSMPLQVVTVLIGLQAVRLARPEIAAFGQLLQPAARRTALRAVARPLALLGLAALLVGTLRATNTWELPTYLGLAGLFGLVAARPGRWTSWPVGLAAGAATLTVVYALSSLLFAPFLARYELFYSGVVPVPTPTSPAQFLLINGALLFFVVGALAYRLGRSAQAARAVGRPRAAQSAPDGAYLTALAPAVTLGSEGRVSAPATAVLMAALLLWAVGYGTLAVLALAAGVAGALAVFRRSSRETLFVVAVAAAALGALGLPELVAVKGDVGRMNTVFKFYLQAWILLAVLAGPGIVLLARALLAGRAGTPRRVPAWGLAWAVVAAALLLATAVYPLLATRVKVGLRFAPLPPTLDGMAYMQHAAYTDRGRDLDLPSDYRAIRWMLENVEGTPVVMEGTAPLYHWGARFSIYTGLPAVLGWDWHQKQQRWGYQEQVDQRQRDVARFYEAPDIPTARAILRKYDVRFVVVGGLERAYYSAAGLAKLDRMVGSELEVAYRDGSVTIYRVVTP